MDNLPESQETTPAKKTGLTLHQLEKYIAMLPPADMPVKHHFSEGVYVRELFLPKNTLAIGKRHRKESINIVLKGSISIFIDEDGEIVGRNGRPVVKKIDAPAIFVSQPFSKKMGYAHEDTILLNVHPSDTTDLDLIEQNVIIPEDEYIEYIEKLQLEGNSEVQL